MVDINATLSHYSSNLLEARSSENLNANYNWLYTTAISKNRYTPTFRLHDTATSSTVSSGPHHVYDRMTRLTNIYKAKIISNNNTFIDEDIEMKEQDDDCLRGPKKNKKELYYTMHLNVSIPFLAKCLAVLVRGTAEADEIQD